MSEPKRMNIKEFKEAGFLMEVNRLFFHPLGLALAVEADDDGEYELCCIYDDREDPEGFVYGDVWQDDDMEKARAIQQMVEDRRVAREAILDGHHIQWIGQVPLPS